MAVDVVEHPVLALRCTCGQRHRSAFVEAVTQAVHYGPNVWALRVRMTQEQLLSFARATQLINDLFSIAISPATLLTSVDEASVALQPTAGTIADSLRAAPSVHADKPDCASRGNCTGCMWPPTTATPGMACMPSAAWRRSPRKPFCRNCLAY
ncbi:transposase [Janthinobacterium sp. NKUCC06_STL]|nr:transposase [Janthinobacterium sp. NKUCC06_STL]